MSKSRFDVDVNDRPISNCSRGSRLRGADQAKSGSNDVCGANGDGGRERWWWLYDQALRKISVASRGESTPEKQNADPSVRFLFNVRQARTANGQDAKEEGKA